MVGKNLNKALLYTTHKYFALVNPAGVATHIGTEERCYTEYHNLRWPNSIILEKRDIERAKETAKASGWQVVPVRMAIFTQDITDANIETIARRP